MTSHIPSISVLMPVYNAERYVAEAVESILNQSFTDFEFIIINDGSTDRSLEILQRYAQQDSRIRLVSRENRGLVATLNEMLTLAQGKYIARMDADDVSLPERFALQAEFLDQHPEIVCVGGFSELMDEKGRVLTVLKPPLDNNEIQELMLKGHVALNHPATMFLKIAIDKVDGYREGFPAAEDLDLWLRMGEIGNLANIAYPIIKYRFSNNSISATQSEKQKDSALRACQEAWQRRNIVTEFEFGQWRPSNDKNSKFKFALRFGWWAFNYRQRRTALIYGFKAVTIKPLNSAGWRLLMCALLKAMPLQVDCDQ